MILVLVILGMRVDDYEPAKNIMVWLWGPPTVGLSVPLYKNRGTLVRHALPALVGFIMSSLSTFWAAMLLAKVFALSQTILASIGIESVTAPIAIELATIIDGSPPLTAVFAITTGMIVVMFGPVLMNICGIYDPLARGLGLGTISRGQGTAQAVIEGGLQGAAAGIAMGLAAAFTSCVSPFRVPFML